MKTKRSPNSPDYWRKLNPNLTISESGGAISDPQLLEADFLAGDWRGQLVDEGYLQFDQAIAADPVARLRTGIENVASDSWPAVFCMVYDEYWRFFAGLRDAILKPILGADCRMLPAFWAWRVDPAAGDAGWRPHRDRGSNTLLEDGMPKCITVWAPLTDATPLNGCVSIIPANLDPDYLVFEKENRVGPSLQHVRALPAPAGSILLWNHRLYHWGGASSPRAKEPRISLAFEFQRGDEPPYKEPLLDPGVLPSFSMRLQLIVKMQAAYRGFTDGGGS